MKCVIMKLHHSVHRYETHFYVGMWNIGLKGGPCNPNISAIDCFVLDILSAL